VNGPLWAVTSYFNPTGSRRRLANYRKFRASLAVPLLAVECSPEGRFELTHGDADLLVQVAGGDLMWQKERLLNLGVARLPPSCPCVAWLDCDILFEGDAWVSEALHRLEEAPLVQLYDRVAYMARLPLDAIAGIGDWRHQPMEFTRDGYAAALPADHRARLVAPEDLETFRRLPSSGFAWAARRDLLVRNPLFDVWICGGGDSAYVLAATGMSDWVVERHRLTRAHREYFLPRAAALAADVSGRVGFVRGTICHLWHGEFQHRRYCARHEILSRHDFDPATFLRVADSGMWAWGDVPATLPVALADYFHGRHEDGADLATPLGRGCPS
jgi:hypothetical protein